MAFYSSKRFPEINTNDRIDLREDVDNFLLELHEGKIQEHVENVMNNPMGKRIIRKFEEEGLTQSEIYDIFMEAAKKSKKKKKKESKKDKDSDEIDVDDVGNSSDVPETDTNNNDSKSDKKKSKKKDSKSKDSSDEDLNLDDDSKDDEDKDSKSDKKKSKKKDKDSDDDSKDSDDFDSESIEDKADTGNKKKKSKDKDSDKDSKKKAKKSDSKDDDLEDIKIEQVDTSLFIKHNYFPSNRELLQEAMDKEFKVDKKVPGKKILKEQLKRPIKEQTSWRLPPGFVPPDKNKYWDKIVREWFDMKDDKTRCVLIACNEEEQSEVLHSLTDKLYDIIVDKAATIDYGGIRDTKGDIQTLPNYTKLEECIELLHDILIEYKQDTDPVDEIKLALDNVISRADTFKKCYMSNVEYGILIYENISLAIIASTSLMLSASIEFIKSPNNDSFQISIDKVGYWKAKNHLLFINLTRFNKLCDNKDMDRSLDAIISQYGKHFLGISTMTGMGLAALVVVLLYNILPMLREFTYFFYYTRTRISDYFNIQADLLELNAQDIEFNQKNTVGDRKTVIKRQRAIADKFRSIANFFMVDAKRAENNANQAISSDKKVFKSDEVIDNHDVPNSNGSSLF